MSDTGIIVFGSFVVFFASCVQGMTGFGNNLIAVPFISLFIPVKTAVPVMNLVGLFSRAYLWFSLRHSVTMNKVMPVLAGALFGLPVGVFLLVIIPEKPLKFIIGAAVIAFGILLLSGFKRKFKNESFAMPVVGVISGMLNGMMAIPGPPIALYYVNQGLSRDVFRANLSAFLTMVSVAALIMMLPAGLITADVVKYSAFFLPSMLLGTAFGNYISIKLKDEHFNKIVLFIVIATGAAAIISALNNH